MVELMGDDTRTTSFGTRSRPKDRSGMSRALFSVWGHRTQRADNAELFQRGIEDAVDTQDEVLSLSRFSCSVGHCSQWGQYRCLPR